MSPPQNKKALDSAGSSSSSRDRSPERERWELKNEDGTLEECVEDWMAPELIYEMEEKDGEGQYEDEAEKGKGV